MVREFEGKFRISRWRDPGKGDNSLAWIKPIIFSPIFLILPLNFVGLDLEMNNFFLSRFTHHLMSFPVSVSVYVSVSVSIILHFALQNHFRTTATSICKWLKVAARCCK